MRLIRNRLILLVLVISSLSATSPVSDLSVKQDIPLEVLGITVTPHVYIDPKFYKASDPFDPENGALVQIIVKNKSKKSIPFRMLFDGLHPSDPKLIQSSGEPAYNKVSNIMNPSQIPEWTWCEMPEQKAFQGRDYTLESGMIDVFTYNSYRQKWGSGYSYSLSFTDLAGKEINSVRLTNISNIASIEFISFLSGKNEGIYPDSAVVHIKNHTKEDLLIRKMRLYTPKINYDSASAVNGMELMKEFDQLKGFNNNCTLPAEGWSGFVCNTGPLPLVRGLVEVVIEKNGREISIWSPIMFKREVFDIGAGWLDYTYESDSIFTVPLSHESFLKTLKKLYINSIHNDKIYSHIPENLHEQYKFRHMLSEFPSIYEHPEIFNTPGFIEKSSRIDCLGEPNHSRTAMESYYIARRYCYSGTFPSGEWHIPTSLDNSMPQRIRYFAGLTDYPCFDNYRITAPSDDRFSQYSERWGKGSGARKTASWGAPIESLGDIVRTLHTVNKPKPIAGWSQNAHHGWGKSSRNRSRISPTSEEIYSQAYQLLANGVTSLYWYSLEASSMLRFRDVLGITSRIGREIRMLESFYLSGAAFSHQRMNLNDNYLTPDLDLNVIVTPNAALLFTLDLNYYPDTAKESASFRFNKRNVEKLFFPLPEYLQNPKELYRIDGDGVYPVKWSTTSDGVIIHHDEINIAGVYIACNDKELINKIENRRMALLDQEKSLNFDPGKNDLDFIKLKNDLQMPR